MTSPLRADEFDELDDFIRIQITAGFAPIDDIVDDAVDVFSSTSPDEQALRDAALAIAQQALNGHVAQQAGWPDTTDCDRLDAAFAELDRAGIVARQHFSCCQTCGAHDIHDEMHQAAKSGAPSRGYAFFHAQDTEHAARGESLYLSYGAADKDRSASVAIGHEVVAVLGRHGLSPAWNGKQAHRIALPIRWQRRR